MDDLRILTSFRRDVLANVLIAVALLDSRVNDIMTYPLRLFARFFVIRLVAMFALRFLASFLLRFLLRTTRQLSNFIDRLRDLGRVLFNRFLRLAFRRRSIFFDDSRRSVRIDLFRLNRYKIRRVFAICANCTRFKGQAFGECI